MPSSRIHNIFQLMSSLPHLFTYHPRTLEARKCTFQLGAWYPLLLQLFNVLIMENALRNSFSHAHGQTWFVRSLFHIR